MRAGFRYMQARTSVLEQLDLMARLAALVPPRRLTLTRFHGVFAPHSRLRAAVTPAHRGLGSKGQANQAPEKPLAPRHVAMIWAQRLRRVFGVQMDVRARCGGEIHEHLQPRKWLQAGPACARFTCMAEGEGIGAGRRRPTVARLVGRGDCGPRERCRQPGGRVQAKLCSERRQGAWFESTIRCYRLAIDHEGLWVTSRTPPRLGQIAMADGMGASRLVNEDEMTPGKNPKRRVFLPSR